MTRAQSDAVKSRIQQVPALATSTFKSTVPGGTEPPYCVIHPADGTDTQERLTGPARTMHPRFTLWIVGETADQVETLTGLVKAKFIVNGVPIPLTITGESFESFWWSSPMPLQVDADPLPALVYQVIELGWTAEPA